MQERIETLNSERKEEMAKINKEVEGLKKYVESYKKKDDLNQKELAWCHTNMIKKEDIMKDIMERLTPKKDPVGLGKARYEYCNKEMLVTSLFHHKLNSCPMLN